VANIALVVYLPAGGEWPRVRPAGAETVPARWRQVFRVSALLQPDIHKLSGIAQIRFLPGRRRRTNGFVRAGGWQVAEAGEMVKWIDRERRSNCPPTVLAVLVLASPVGHTARTRPAKDR